MVAKNDIISDRLLNNRHDQFNILLVEHEGRAAGFRCEEPAEVQQCSSSRQWHITSITSITSGTESHKIQKTKLE